MMVKKFFAMLDVSCVPPRRGGDGDGDGVQASSRPVVSRESEDAWLSAAVGKISKFSSKSALFSIVLVMVIKFE